ncbi:hypothetical protein ACFLR3_01285 [Campylobacterota bacterium]
MIKDIFFIFFVLSVSIYAHSNRDDIINFIEVYEEEGSSLTEVISE